MVNRNTEWCAVGILTSVTSSYGIFFIINHIEIPLEISNNLTSYFGQTILFYQWQDGGLCRSQNGRQF